MQCKLQLHCSTHSLTAIYNATRWQCICSLLSAYTAAMLKLCCLCTPLRSGSLYNFFQFVSQDFCTCHIVPTWQFWDSGGVKLESLCNFSIVGCQGTVNCLLGSSLSLSVRAQCPERLFRVLEACRMQLHVFSREK